MREATAGGARVVRLTAIALSLVAFVLGIVGNGRRSLWLDEGVSASIAAGGWRALWRTLHSFDPNMSLYDVLMHWWHLLGASESWLRGLSAVCAAAAVYVTFLWGHRLAGATAGLCAAAVLAVAPLSVRYSQELRSYELVMLLVAVSSLLLVRFVEHPTRAAALAYALVAALGVYAHAYALLAVLAQLVSLALLGRDRPPRRLLVLTGTVLVLGMLPFGLVVVTGHQAGIDWITRPTLSSLRALAANVAGNNGLLVVLGALLVTTGVLAVQALRRGGPSLAAWRLGVAVLGAVVPAVIAVVVSLTVKPIVVDRYLIVCLPALAVASGIALARIPLARIRGFRIPGRMAQAAVLVVIVAGSAVTIRNFHDESTKEDWRALVAFVAGEVQPGDGIVFCEPGTRPAFEYYALRRPASERPRPLSPPAPWGGGARVEQASARAVAGWSSVPRIWVVELSDPSESSGPACDLPRSMAGRTRAVDRTFAAVGLRRYDSDG